MTTPKPEEPLPPGWKWVKLGEVCVEIEGTDPRKTPDKAFTYIDISSIDRNKKCVTSPSIILGKNAPSRAKREVRVGDVLVSTTRPNLNAVALVNPELDGQVCSTGLCVLRPGPSVISRYLFYFVRTGRFVKGLTDLVAGALYPAVTDVQVFDQDVPLPPLPEQQRIVARLERQMALVEKARLAAEEMLENISSLKNAILRELLPSLGQKLPQGWKWVKLGEVCTEDRRTVKGDSSLAKTLPYLSLEHIESNTGRIRITSASSSQSLGRSNSFAFDERHLLYGKLRPYLNKVALPDFRGRCTTETIPLLPIDINREYLAWILRRPETVEYATRTVTGSRMPRASIDDLLTMPISLPPLAEQERIVSDLEVKIAGVGRIEELVRQQITDIGAMPVALLRQAFDGAL